MSHHTVIYRWADPAALLARHLFVGAHGVGFERQWIAVAPDHDECAHPWTNVVEIRVDGATLIAGDDPGSPARED